MSSKTLSTTFITVRSPPKCKKPVGLGANLTRTSWFAVLVENPALTAKEVFRLKPRMNDETILLLRVFTQYVLGLCPGQIVSNIQSTLVINISSLVIVQLVALVSLKNSLALDNFFSPLLKKSSIETALNELLVELNEDIAADIIPTIRIPISPFGK
jgi:hypothetical protein